MAKAFFYHYNKPASRSRGRPVISLHFAGRCHLVDNIVCDVPTYGRIRKTQPLFVVAGQAEKIEIGSDGVARLS
jgi:hypothetical protein